MYLNRNDHMITFTIHLSLNVWLMRFGLCELSNMFYVCSLSLHDHANRLYGNRSFLGQENVVIRYRKTQITRHNKTRTTVAGNLNKTVYKREGERGKKNACLSTIGRQSPFNRCKTSLLTQQCLLRALNPKWNNINMHRMKLLFVCGAGANRFFCSRRFVR